jgi:hypothetical protein
MRSLELRSEAYVASYGARGENSKAGTNERCNMSQASKLKKICMHPSEVEDKCAGLLV